jgi:hypothetical protein
LRIPIVLDFFAHGRSGALLNADLKRLLCSTLFELSDIAVGPTLAVESFPTRPTAKPEELAKVLGTPEPLLITELLCAPAISVVPVKLMLHETVKAASKTDFQAPFLPLMLFLLCLATRLLAYLHVAAGETLPSAEVVTEFITMLEGEVKPLMSRWSLEATHANAYATVAKIQLHLAFLHAMLVRVRPHPTMDNDVTDVSHVLGCMAYVEAWNFNLAAVVAEERAGDKHDADKEQRVKDEDLLPNGVELTMTELLQAFQVCCTGVEAGYWRSSLPCC